MIMSDSTISDAALREAISTMLRKLSYREREIIKLRYGLGDGYTYTLEEVGHIFKVSHEHIRQVERKAITKLGTIMECEDHKTIEQRLIELMPDSA
jgi:RNA polymerase sigma factor (sigma-70 family)